MASKPVSPHSQPEHASMGTFEALLAMLVVGVVVAIAVGALV